MAPLNARVRAMEREDVAVWSQMRAALWSEDTAEGHAAELAAVVQSDDLWGFLAELEGQPAGFAEVSIRRFANGCRTSPVPFLEGVWVQPAFRRRGIGARLIAHSERVALQRGFHEIGSDALLDNLVSHAAHRRWGFQETERVVYFRKDLTDGPPEGLP